MPLTNAIRKHGTFIYDALESVNDYGSAEMLAAAAERAGMTHAWVRIHGVNPVGNEKTTRSVILALKAKNIAVAGWGWLQGSGVDGEAQLALDQLALYGLSDYVADIEQGVNNAQWTKDEVKTLLSTLRPKVSGALVVSTFPVIQWHDPELMEVAIPLVDAFAPQAYWFHFPNQTMRNQFPKPDGGKYALDNAAEYVNLTIDLWRKLTDKPLIVTGQSYWGEGIDKDTAQAKLDEFLPAFSRWGDIIAFNWWHFGGNSAMSHQMLESITAAQMGQKAYGTAMGGTSMGIGGGGSSGGPVAAATSGHGGGGSTESSTSGGSAYAQALADLATDQFNKYHELNENEPVLKAQIRHYWEDLGYSFPGVGTAWSAVFVCWCVIKAGASTAEWHVAEAHWEYIRWAIRNQLANKGLFRGHRLDEYPVKVGDIITNNRSGGSVTYDEAGSASDFYPSHGAIVVEVGQDSDGHYARTVGGNESDSVRRVRVGLTESGHVAQIGGHHYICVIENLKA